MRFEFSEYVNQHWDAEEFCHSLAEDAREAIQMLFEMAMGKKKIADPKFGVMHDESDYKFLSQFPYNVWTHALNWRYNKGLRDMMRKAKDEFDIPEGHDWTDEIIFPSGVAGKYYRFGKRGGDKKIYIGLTELAKKLVKPVKGFSGYIEKHPHNPDLPHPHWPGEGPSLEEINPLEKDENSPNHPSKYIHGHYDYDLADMAEVTDEDIDAIPATDIQAMLGPPLSKQPLKSPEVQAAIARIRAKMKNVKKHTFSTYSVPQHYTTQDNISDWLTANALKLYGDHPTTYHDELTDKTHEVSEKTPAQMKSQYNHGNAFKKKAGGEEGEEGDYSLRHNIPTINKQITFDEIDKDGNLIDKHSKSFDIPVLNPVKALPQLHKAESAIKITPEQRLKIALIRKPQMADIWNVGPGERLNELIKKWGDPFKTASKIDTFKNFVRFWDIWTPEQKEWVRQNAKTMIDMSKKVHSGEGIKEIKAKIAAYNKKIKNGETLTPEEQAHLDSLHKEQLSKPQNLYIPGPRPNYGSQGQGSLDIPKEKMSAFRAKYLPKLELELLGDATEGTGQGYEGGGLIERILKRMARDPKNPPQVITALESREKELAKFAAYNLLTWMNDPRFGMGVDPEFNLLTGIDKSIDKEENAIRRAWKVENFLKSAAQIGFNDVLSRRRREKSGMGLIGTLDASIGDTGKTGASQVTAGQKPKEILDDMPSKRRWLNSDPGSIARAGQKSHSSLAGNSSIFFAQRRQQILKKLEGMAGVKEELDEAEKAIENGIKMAIELYQKYDEELEASIPDELERENEIMKRIYLDLSKHPTLSHLKAEEIIAKTKPLVTKAKPLSAALEISPDDAKMKAAMDTFMHSLLKSQADQPIRLPVWDDVAKQVTSSPQSIVLSDLPPHTDTVAEIIAYAYQNHPKLVIDALKQWGFEFYKKIVSMHDDIDKDEEKLNKKWQDEVAAWEEKYAADYDYKAAAQLPPPPAPPAAPAQPAAQPAMAAKSIGQTLPELLNWASKVNSIEDIVKVGQAILNKKNELMAQKGSAAQVEKAMDAMRDRRKFIKDQHSPQEYKIFNDLMQLQSELEVAHE